jgi:O-acetyl-ADP-ribose deacetylase (regulator of RNase III)
MITAMNGQLKGLQGDITRLQVDAVVNAANSSLLGGGGVDGAIHRAGGPQILEACRAIRARQGSCRPGQAVITTGGDLPAQFVIHTVGPVWRGGQQMEPGLLAGCYTESLRLAAENSLSTVAFPAISCGVYRYPIADATQIAVSTTAQWLREHNSTMTVTFCCFTDEIWETYQNQLGSL